MCIRTATATATRTPAQEMQQEISERTSCSCRGLKAQYEQKLLHELCLKLYKIQRNKESNMLPLGRKSQCFQFEQLETFHIILIRIVYAVGDGWVLNENVKILHQ